MAILIAFLVFIMTTKNAITVLSIIRDNFMQIKCKYMFGKVTIAAQCFVLPI